LWSAILESFRGKEGKEGDFRLKRREKFDFGLFHGVILHCAWM